jgi:hypothetical protein
MMPIHTNKFRPFARLEVSDEPIIGNAGLAGIGQLMRNRSQGKSIEIIELKLQ